ncbi:MAG: hypothetical protein JNM52_03135, partial [Betaproteobacteria bacterium]|nr:hypothetical protein [Betaproteobacteria bacterium]
MTKAHIPTSPDPGADNASQDIFSLIERNQDVTRASAAMQAMSHVLRFKILCLLSSGE